ncbi:dihydrofolate reductase [Mobilicoccus massiliensis]|uniref:dihydrofolate reductase n=1 Tax=Mobilicoccus massiliensis TaxID=1522310 RepID=UPI000694DCD3|nr:dihydrofolate reductase [Mobilicoccus massiliensis]
MSTHPRTARDSEIVLVALVAANGVIGDGTDQPWHFREDFRRFKSLTMGHPLVMGRRTHEAIGRALPGRETVVLTRDPSWSSEGVRVAHDLEEALDLAAELPGGEHIMVLGGGQIYEAVLPRADRLELTEVDADAEGDTRFPRLDPDSWTEVARDDRLAFAFVTYRRTE